MSEKRIRRKVNVDIPSAMKKLKVIIHMLMTTKFLETYVSVFRGKGLEFDSYRSYTMDDDASLIDWKASARTKELLVRKYVEERKLEVFFLIDVSNSMVFGSTEKLKNEYVAELVVALANAVLTAGDKVGYALFNSDITIKSPPLTGKKQFYTLANALVNPNTYGGGFDLYNALKFPLSFLKPGGIIFIISDFIGMKDDNWVKPLKWLSVNFDVIFLMIRDPRDKMLPRDAGQVLVADPYSHREVLVDAKLVREAYQACAERQEKELKRLTLESGVDLVPISTDESFVKPIVELFMMRKRRWK